MRLLCSFVAYLIWATVAAAQTPLGAEFIPASLDVDASFQGGASIACNEASLCALVWSSFKPDGQVNNARQWARTISPAGKLSPVRLLRADEGIGDFTPLLAVDDGFALFSQTIFPGRIFVPNFRLYDSTLQPLGDFVLQPYHEPPEYGDSDSISSPANQAVIPDGFVEVGFGFDQSQIPCDFGTCAGVFLFSFDREGRKLHERVQVNEDSSGWEEYPLNNLAVDGNSNIIVTFHRIYPVFPTGGVKAFVRRFSPDGDPLGLELEVGAGLPGNQLLPVVAASSDGEFLVVWLNKADPFADFGEIYARRFDPDGEPLGPAFLVSDAIPAQTDPRVTADRYGNYFVAWSSYQEFNFDARGRLYRHDGRPVTRGFRLNQVAAYDQLVAMAAFAPNGTLTVSYGTNNLAQTHGQSDVPVIRRYAASPGQEICGISGSEIRCDLARTGGAAELQLTWGRRSGEVTLFGDVDGDGRDDVCSYFKGRFRCDVSHEGGKATWSDTFGSAGDIPLLADVNGDGRADPCLRRKNRLLCDTVQDGSVHYQVVFGRGDETQLLGDLDGDYKADLCLVSGAAWDCRLATGQPFHFQFGHRGDSPALGDADKDGRADPCVLRPGGRVECDTKHDGGLPDFALALNMPTGARLLFGNLDGL
ncbi:MAG TPA: hypothetical protein VGX68_05485 [Thermoanaerobaculia bacterium]|jgi:hypothetical protein|nr:hypothetical protein [Thermoanaerobaculia bacterium]